MARKSIMMAMLGSMMALTGGDRLGSSNGYGNMLPARSKKLKQSVGDKTDALTRAKLKRERKALLKTDNVKKSKATGEKS